MSLFLCTCYHQPMVNPDKLIITTMLSLAFIAVVGCGDTPTAKETAVAAEATDTVGLTEEQLRIRAIVKSEDLILQLVKRLNQLKSYWSNDKEEFPVGLFADDFQYQGIDSFELDKPRYDGPLVKKHKLPIASAMNSSDPTEIWRSLLERASVEEPAFGFVSGHFEDPTNPITFVTDTKFESNLSFADSETIGGVHAKQTITWTLADSGEWKIGRWVQSKFVIDVSAPVFEDATSTAIPNPETLDIAVRSPHKELLVKRALIGNPGQYLAPPKMNYPDFGDWGSTYQFPGASVVDIDQDGWDDLFLTNRGGKSLFLRNQGDGTFVDISESSGLAVKDYASCALFFDVDNDGDSDALVCQVLKPCLFFINHNGKFQQDEKTNEQLVDAKCVVSATAVDVNRDGLLDVYLSTYAIGPGNKWAKEAVRAEDVPFLELKLSQQNYYFDRAGPPNILLMNRGGKLQREEISEQLEQWRTTYQASWSDIDNDGDSDLYLCNDFAKDVVLRNDTEQGSFDLRFEDVTDKFTPEALTAFSMGASWGDFNNDAELDLYVSNMYSKAGQRISSRLDNADPRIAVAAKGNFLYQKVGQEYKQVAGSEPDDQHVSIVGWSFGGQFADFDNDGSLDLFVPSGLYTAPPKIATEEDM